MSKYCVTEGDMEKPIIEMHERSGKIYRIWVDGRSEGFEEGAIIYNNALALINLAKGLTIKAINNGLTEITLQHLNLERPEPPSCNHETTKEPLPDHVHLPPYGTREAPDRFAAAQQIAAAAAHMDEIKNQCVLQEDVDLAIQYIANLHSIAMQLAGDRVTELYGAENEPRN